MLESGNMDEWVTVSASDTTVEPAKMGIRAGDRYRRRDLLRAMMVRAGASVTCVAKASSSASPCHPSSKVSRTWLSYRLDAFERAPRPRRMPAANTPGAYSLPSCKIVPVIGTPAICLAQPTYQRIRTKQELSAGQRAVIAQKLILLPARTHGTRRP